MKKTIIAALVVAPLALAACTPAEGGTATASSTTSTAVEYVADDEVIQAPPVIEEKVATEEDRFLGRLDGLGIAYTSEEDAILGGLTVCTFVDEGNSTRDLIWEMAIEEPQERVLPPISNDNLPEFMGVAVSEFCPELTARVQRDLERGW